MKNARLICIDFGSAYTKVAFRQDWNEAAELVRGSPLASRDMNFCIPSVVARVERPDGVRWLVGQAAAGQLSGKEVRIFRHWKAKLLADAQAGPVPADQAAKGGATQEKVSEYREVAVTFFRALQDTVRLMALPVDPADCPVRLCIPKLGQSTQGRERMVAILKQAGWRPTDNGPTVYEPESNTCGVFTRGRNATWHPTHPFSSGHFPYYPQMFDQDGLFNGFRRGALEGRSVRYGVLVIDVGAFTTDFGFVKFDDSFFTDAMPRPDIVQLSREIGVRELDRSVFDRMRPEVQQAIRQISTTAWESTKQLFYAGKPAAIRNPADGMFVIGEGTEARTVADAVNEFADRVVRAKDEFCREQVKGKIHAQVLTGGGAMIPLVRQALVQAMKSQGGTRVYDLLDPDEPRRALLPRRGPWGWDHDKKEVEQRQRQNLELVRGGSAMGGCSVFFE